MGNYKNMNQVDELTKILESLQQIQHNARTGIDSTFRLADLEGNIVILSRNPEMFLRHLKQPIDESTKKIMMQTQAQVSNEDYAGIFASPLKLKLLTTYLQSNPIHFMTLLRSDVLTTDQMTVLSDALSIGSSSQGQAAYMSNTLVTGPDTGIEQPQKLPLPQVDASSLSVFGAGEETVEGFEEAVSDPTYLEAINLLDLKINAQPPSTGQSLPQPDLMNTIRHLNNNISDVHARANRLEMLLAEQSAVIGLIISKQSGKCIGAISRNGKISHCSRKAAQSPYDIIVNGHDYQLNLNNILQQHHLHGTTVEGVQEQTRKLGMIVLGQCVNVYGKTIGLIVRAVDGNHYIPVKPSTPNRDIPILAIISSNQTEQRSVAAAPTPPQSVLDKTNTFVAQMMSSSTDTQISGVGAPLSEEEAQEESVSLTARLDTIFGRQSQESQQEN
jgi:hypothetical protein